MSTFPARYGGRCGACDFRIDEGDLVTYTDDELTHAICAEYARPERPETICQSCWLVQPCDCEASE